MVSEIQGHIPQGTIQREMIPPIGRLSYQDTLIQRLFGGELTFQAHTENATPLISTLYRYSFDAGLLQTREFETPEGEVLKAEGIPMYNRAAFLARAEEIMKKKDFNGSFVLMDIAKFRDADMAEDSMGNKSADYLLNKVGKQLTDAISRLKSEHSNSDTEVDIEISRYGGDEFMFLINGVTQEKKKQIIQELTDVTTRIKGYFINNDENKEPPIIQENIGLKKVETIEIPMEPFQRAIFQYYLPRGLILESEEIDNIVKHHSTEMQQMLDHATIPSIYPDGLINSSESAEELLKKKKEYLVMRHPELALTFAVGKDDVAKEAILTYVERVMYDPLLHEVVMGFTDLEGHLSRGDYKSAVVFDIKFIKEINDTRSIVEGDKAIQELWQQIQNKLGEEDRTNYQVYRRGGTFIIASKAENSALDLKLELLNQQKIKWNGIEIPLGYSQRDFTRFNEELRELEATETSTIEKAKQLYIEKRKKIRAEFGNMLLHSTQDWQYKIGQHMEQKMMEYGNPHMEEVEGKHEYTIDDLIYMYYMGAKRGIERNLQAIQYYEDKNTGDRNTNDHLVQFHRACLNNVREIKALQGSK